MSPQQRLDYLISEKGKVLVVVFLGAFSEENAPAIEKCQKELLEHSGRYCIFYFRDVIQMSVSATPAFIRLQESAREQFGKISLCSLKPSFRDLLVSKGIVRHDELANNLLEAWQGH
jgi:anti-anti-sigma regulatory factor